MLSTQNSLNFIALHGFAGAWHGRLNGFNFINENNTDYSAADVLDTGKFTSKLVPKRDKLKSLSEGSTR